MDVVRLNPEQRQPMKLPFISALLLSAMLLAPDLRALHAQDPKTDVTGIIKETQKLDTTDGVSIIWWIPNDYWQRSLANNHRLTPSQVDDFMKTLEGYTVMLVIDARKGPMATFTYPTPEVLRKNTKLILPSGDILSPLSDDELTPAAKNLFSMVKPLLGSMLGQFGQNAEFMFFNNKDKDGKPLLDPTGTGKLVVNSNGHSATWRLPLGSLLAEKTCPVCGEKLPGNYMFCPYDGTKLK
jgi:hypothetical protein